MHITVDQRARRFQPGFELLLLLTVALTWGEEPFRRRAGQMQRDCAVRFVERKDEE